VNKLLERAKHLYTDEEWAELTKPLDRLTVETAVIDTKNGSGELRMHCAMHNVKYVVVRFREIPDVRVELRVNNKANVGEVTKELLPELVNQLILRG